MFYAKIKATKFINIKHSKQTCPIFHNPSHFFKQKWLQISLCETWFSKYMLLKIEILLIPLLANSHIFEISEDDHPRLVTDARDH
jgi:hypothetical protein